MIELIKVLKPARIATMRLQTELLLLSDLYEIWQRCLMDVKKENTEFASEFVNNHKEIWLMIY